jgi:hypothetical protein
MSILLTGLPVVPAADLPQFDLVIASKKTFGISSQAEAPILWWKLAGKPRETPARPCALTDPAIQKRLLGYRLVNTETRQGMVIRRYRRIQ